MRNTISTKNRLTILNTLAIAIVLLVSSCSKPTTLTPNEIVDSYFEGLNTSDFSKIEPLLSDSIQSYEMKHTIAQGIKQQYGIFQWDSIFKPHYTIIKKKDIGNDFVEVEVLKQCNRISFLTDTTIEFKVNFSISDSKIESINTCEYIRIDIEKWRSRLDSLTQWVGLNHPELNGFNRKITIEGGNNYKKAMALYNAEKGK